ncbi:MAG: hypothetical protein II727_10615 [Oscillospiraceae bacterium]|nr:hypothetical protein [Oscillospiraceae bacterium]
MRDQLRAHAAGIFIAAAVIVLGLVRLLIAGLTYRLHLQPAYTLIFLSAAFFWLHSIRRQFIPGKMRTMLTVSAGLVILLFLLRYIRYDLADKESALSRMLWYAYYIPFIVLPLLIFLSTLYIGKTDRSAISPWWRLSYIPAGVLALAVLTNDLHGLAFRFCDPARIASLGYAHGPVYYAALAFVGLCIVGILAVVFRGTASRRFFRSAWFPALILLLGVIYMCAYRNTEADKLLFQRMFELPEFFCFFFICFFQSLVLTNLIPSNRSHAQFLRGSTLQTGLADEKGRVVLHALGSPEPEPAQILSADKAPAPLEGGDWLLKTQRVHGGWFYWIEDVRSLLALNQALADTGDYLAEEYAMLDAANRLEESRKRAQAQNRLYDRIARALDPQLDSLSALLDELPEEEDAFRARMKLAAVQGAYIKRRSNLLLLADTEKTLPSAELGVSIAESLDYLRLSGIEAQAIIAPDLDLDTEKVIFLYALFEDAVENALPALSAALVSLRKTREGILFYIELAEACAPASEKLCAQAEKYGRFTLDFSPEESILSLILSGKEGEA